MVNKLLSVEMEAFRAYSGLQKLDFKMGKEVADLVLIYAPNGSGKTTIFDSLEWAMTGRISRISENDRVKETANKNKGEILKNYESKLDFGRVKITASNHNVLEVRTKKIDRRRKTDYNPGDKHAEGIFLSEENKIGFIEKNILKNHQIDKFLRFQNSVERYEALSIFWDKNNESQKYVTLLEIIYETKKVQKNLEKDISKINEDLLKMSMSKSLINSLEKYVSDFNKLDPSNQIHFDFKKDTYSELYDIAIKLKSEKEVSYKKAIEDYRMKMNFYEDYKVELIKLENNHKKITSYEIPKHTKLLDDLFLVDRLKKVKISKHEKIALIDTMISDFNFLKENKNMVNKMNEEIKSKKEKIDCLLQDKIRINDLLKKDLDLESEFKNKLNNVRKKVKIASEQMNYIVETNDIHEHLLQLNKELDSINKNGLTKQKKSLDEELILLKGLKQNLIEIKNIDYRSIFENSEYENIINKYYHDYYTCIHKEIKKLDSINISIESLNIEIQNNINLSSDLEKLKKLSIDLITQNQSSSCPVCSTSFNEHQLLVKRIEDSISDMYDLSHLYNSLNELYKKNEHGNKILNQLYLELVKLIEIKLQTLIVEINIKEIEKVELIHQLQNQSEIEKKIKLLNIQLENKKLEVSKQFDDLEIQLDFNHLQKKMSDVIESEERDVIYFEKYLTQISAEIAKNKIEINSIDLTINMLDKEINGINDNSLINRYNDIIKNNDVKSLSLKQLQNEKSKIEDELLILNSEISKLNYELSIEEVRNKISNLNTVKEKLEKEINIFKKNIVRHFNIINIDEIDRENVIFLIKKDIEDTKEFKELTEMCIENLSFITNTLVNYLENNLLNEKVHDLNFLKNELKKVKSKLKLLNQVKNESHDYLKKKISTAFNENSINKIFQMIDPLSFESEINFEVGDFKEGYLGMDVFFKEKNGKFSQSKSPILYLSSAQVNILSLSIFLASAIENSSLMNTILMDDPLQHLDGLNLLSFIDLIRIISFSMGIQLIISTHNKTFFDLCQKKIDPKFYNAKFIELTPNSNDVQ